MQRMSFTVGATSEIRALGASLLERARRIASQPVAPAVSTNAERPDPRIAAERARFERLDREIVTRRELFAERERFAAIAGFHFWTVAVSASYADRARAIAAMAAAELGVEMPRIDFFDVEPPEARAYVAERGGRDWEGFDHPRDVWGMAYREQRLVLVRAKLDPELLAEVVAHEVAHVAGGDEDAALSYGQTMRARLPRAN